MGTTDNLLQRRIGAVLTQLRKHLGLSRSKAAQYLGTSNAKLRHYEEGSIARTEPATVAEWARDLGAPQSLIDELKEKARLTGIPNLSVTRWEMYRDTKAGIGAFAALDATATAIDSFASDHLHGLFQTQEYARAITAQSPKLTQDTVEKVVQARMERAKEIFERIDSPPHIRAVFGESVLARMRTQPFYDAQLEHLRAMNDRENVSISLLTEAASFYAGMSSSYRLMTFASETEPDVVYTEGPAGGAYDSNRTVLQAYRDIFAIDFERATPLEDWEGLTA